MNHLFSLVVRRNAASTRTAVLWALSITCAVCLCVDLFIGRKHSPMAAADPYFFILAIAFMSWGIWVHRNSKLTLNISQNDDKTVKLEILLKNGETLTVDRPTKLEAFYIDEYHGRGARTKELYLKFFDTEDHVALTLKYAIGGLNDVPLGFRKVRPSEVQAANIFTCSKTAAVHQELIKWVRKD